jgi:hypothetical protein
MGAVAPRDRATWPCPEPVATSYRQYGLFTSRHGKVYHEYRCQSVLHDSKRENFVVYGTVETARAGGRRACRKCEPQ